MSPDSVSGVLGADTTIDFSADYLAMVSGNVTLNGAPLSGTEITLKSYRDSDPIDGGVFASAETGTGGQYFFHGAPKYMSYCLEAKSPKYYFKPGSYCGSIEGDLVVNFKAIDSEIDPTPTPTVTPTKTPNVVDLSSPIVHARKGKRKRRNRIRLTYRVSDNSGITKESITLWRRKKVVKKIETNFVEIPAREKRTVICKIGQPKRKLRFCIVASDQSGNLSNESCGVIKPKKNTE